jgi:CRP-like cAMP-binding protein
MENELIKIISSQMSLSKELEKILEEIIVVKSYKKGTVLLKEGEPANEQFIIFKGCIRSYVYVDGEEKILEFYTEGQPVNPVSYGSNTPSTHYLDCIEDTVACVNTPQYEKEILLAYPQLTSVCRVQRIVSDKMLSDNQASFNDYRVASAGERYLKLIKERPNLIQRVPQYQLASYLGIRPETLSRIRKKLSTK